MKLTFDEVMRMPFMEALALLVKGAVNEYLDQSGLLAAIAEAANKGNQDESDSLDSKGALEYLNANGYPMKKGQLYKLTSDPDSGLPFQKFGNKLHFRKSELKAWAESRLIDGNAIGYLMPDAKKKGGGR